MSNDSEGIKNPDLVSNETNEIVEITLDELGTAPWDKISRKRKRVEGKSKEEEEEAENVENEKKDGLYPRQDEMKEGDTVIIYEGFNDLYLCLLKKNGVFQKRYGLYDHDDIIGKPYGSRIASSKGVVGFIHVLKPTPELWSTSLGKRTQIIYPPDQSYIIFNLSLKPGSLVIESGTGSGAMSFAIIRTIAPTGHLYTFEFNEHRAVTAREDFEKLGLDRFVTVTHKDVCGKLEGTEGGFGKDLKDKADAVFLDLPEPWLAIHHARDALKYNGTLCSYSPCIEQTMRVCEALSDLKFHSIRTMEVRMQYIEAREHRFEQLPFNRQDFDELESIIKATKKAKMDCFSKKGNKSQRENTEINLDDSKILLNDSHENVLTEHAEESVNIDKSSEMTSKVGPKQFSKYCKGSGVDEDLYHQFNVKKREFYERSSSLKSYGRPKQEMRGHTAFLTFAVKHG